MSNILKNKSTGSDGTLGELIEHGGRVVNSSLLKHIQLNHKLHEGQGGCKFGRSCIGSNFPLMNWFLNA